MNETNVVIRSICLAIEKVKQQENFPEDTPLIILGGKGFIGRRVIKELKNKNTHCVDVKNNRGFSNDWPDYLSNQKSILVNISRSFVLKYYMPHIWPNLVLLNEVYPEPNKEEVAQYRKKGGNVYHLAGVKGTAFPSFPKAYSGSIPCSASHYNKNIDCLLYTSPSPRDA